MLRRVHRREEKKVERGGELSGREAQRLKTLYTYMLIQTYAYTYPPTQDTTPPCVHPKGEEAPPPVADKKKQVGNWPLHDIAIANIVTVYSIQHGSRGESYIAQ